MDLNGSNLTDDEIVRLLIVEFDQFCAKRHRDGEAEYGATGFMKHNMFNMIVEEMADMMNYMRYQYVKMRLLEGVFENAGGSYYPGAVQTEDEHGLSHDLASIVGAGGLQELLQKRQRLQDNGQRGE